MQEVWRLLDIDKQYTSYYHSETNVVAERFHGTLNAMMGRMVSETQTENKQKPSPSIWRHTDRASVHQSTGYSPNYLMFARKIRAPTDLVFGTQKDQPPTSFHDYSASMEDKMHQACLERTCSGC